MKNQAALQCVRTPRAGLAGSVRSSMAFGSARHCYMATRPVATIRLHLGLTVRLGCRCSALCFRRARGTYSPRPRPVPMLANRQRSDELKYTALERYCRLTGQKHSEVMSEEQQSDYQAGISEIDGQLWRIRTARITPTKSGGFVAIWRRDTTGTTAPYESEEGFQGVMVFIAEADHFGVFRFTQQHLEHLGVFASASAPGKRGFRVYPSWTTGLKGQAKKSQEAQLPAFTAFGE